MVAEVLLKLEVRTARNVTCRRQERVVIFVYQHCPTEIKRRFRK